MRDSAQQIVSQLEKDGIVVFESFVTGSALESLQMAMQSRLTNGCWNFPLGYTNDDNYRWMVEDVLAIDEQFQATALDPRLLPAMKEYLGPTYTLTEAKAWRSLPSKKDFHGWHNDAWYDHSLPHVPRQLKLAVYLTDVKSGAFSYIRGTHGSRTRHTHWSGEKASSQADKTVTVTGKAGSAFLFDTSGIHRQTFPILEQRDAIFLCYNDPTVPLQAEDVSYYRYHPLVLNAAFLGGLSAEEQRVLGFGNKALYRPAYVRAPGHPKVARILNTANCAFISVNRTFRRGRGLVQGAFRIGRRKSAASQEIRGMG